MHVSHFIPESPAWQEALVAGRPEISTPRVTSDWARERPVKAPKRIIAKSCIVKHCGVYNGDPGDVSCSFIGAGGCGGFCGRMVPL